MAAPEVAHEAFEGLNPWGSVAQGGRGGGGRSDQVAGQGSKCVRLRRQRLLSLHLLEPCALELKLCEKGRGDVGVESHQEVDKAQAVAEGEKDKQGAVEGNVLQNEDLDRREEAA